MGRRVRNTLSEGAMKNRFFVCFSIFVIAILHMSCADEPASSSYMDHWGETEPYPTEPHPGCDPGPDPYIPDSTEMSGTVKLPTINPDLSDARFFVLINEIDETDSSQRILEVELQNPFYRGEDPRYITSETNVFQGGLDISHVIKYSFVYYHPDERSFYSFGLMIDVDGDGEASHGDYITQEMSPIVPNERQENTILNVERVFSDSIPLVSGGVSFPEGVELTEESVMTIRLLDSTDPEGHFLVIEESLDELTELPTEYQLFGELPTKRAQYALEISYDSDGDGVADLKSDTVSVLTFGEDDVLDLSLEFISDEDEVDD